MRDVFAQAMINFLIHLVEEAIKRYKEGHPPSGSAS